MRANKTYSITEFKGLMDSEATELMPKGYCSGLTNLGVNNRQLAGVYAPTDLTGPFLSQTSLGAFVKQVFVDDAVASALGQSTNIAYLVVNRFSEAHYVSADGSTTVSIIPVQQLYMATRSSSEARNKCLVTGWKYNTFQTSSTLIITRGSTPDMFKFSTNGGSTYSADQAVSTSGTAISVTYGAVSTTLTVYFQDTEIDSGVSWGWSAVSPANPLLTDFLTPGMDRQVSFTYLFNDLVFTWGAVIMYCNGSGLASVGYERTTGVSVCNYYNHLVIGQFSENEQLNYSTLRQQPTKQFRVAWSDTALVSNYHNFYPQQNNEADEFTLDIEMPVVEEFAGITGLVKYNDSVYIFTPTTVYEMSYVGLPLVMQIRNLYGRASCGIPNALTVAPVGIFTLDVQGRLRLFNGQSQVNQNFAVDFSYEKFNLVSTLNGGPSGRPLFPGYAQMHFNAVSNQLLIHYLYPDESTEDLNAGVTTFETKWKLFEFSIEEQAWGSHDIHNTNYIALGANSSDIIYPMSNLEAAIGDTSDFICINDDYITKLDKHTLGATYNQTALAEFRLTDLGERDDVMEINSIILDLICAANTGPITVTITISGYKGDYTSNVVSTVSRSANYSDSIRRMRFDNLRSYGSLFKLTINVIASGGAVRYFLLKNITLNYRGNDKDVEK